MLSPVRGGSDDQAERFDSRVVDRALELSLNRKVWCGAVLCGAVRCGAVRFNFF